MGFKRFVRAAVMAASVSVAASAQADAEPKQIVAFGDSLTAGYGVGPGESFPEKLQAALKSAGHDVVITNAGVSGDTSAGGLARLDWSIPNGTDIVILELGANDMLRGISPDITRGNLDAMIGKLKARGITVILAGMRAAPNLGPGYVASYDSIFTDLAAKYRLPLYPFFLDGVVAQRSLIQPDGLHPNAKGVDVIVSGILPTVEAVLDGKSGS